MRPSPAVFRARFRLAFGEVRPPTYHKKKRTKHFHWQHGNHVYLPGKNSPLYPMVEEVRSLPLSWWEAKHLEGQVHRLTPEEIEENKRLEAERQKIQQEKRVLKERRRAAVVAREAMLRELDLEAQPRVQVFLEKQKQDDARRKSRHV